MSKNTPDLPHPLLPHQFSTVSAFLLNYVHWLLFNQIICWKTITKNNKYPRDPKIVAVDDSCPCIVQRYPSKKITISPYKMFLLAGCLFQRWLLAKALLFFINTWHGAVENTSFDLHLHTPFNMTLTHAFFTMNSILIVWLGWSDDQPTNRSRWGLKCLRVICKNTNTYINIYKKPI